MSMFRSLLMSGEKKEPYILSDGVEYINSGFMPLNHSCEMKFALSNTNGSKAITGAYQMSFKYYWIVDYDNDNNTIRSSYTNADKVPWSDPSLTTVLMPTLDTNKHTVLYNETNNHYLYFDGILKNTMTGFRQFQTGNNSYILIFANCTYYSSAIPSNINKGAFKLYYIKFKNNDTGIVEREYVPAINNGVACLYEKVQGQYYYGNNGGNNFVYGED